MSNFHVSTIRRGPKGEIQDKAAILAGAEPLMVRDKIRIDSEGPIVPPKEIDYVAYYDDQPEISFSGDNSTVVLQGAHWLLGPQGLDQLHESAGYTTVLRLSAGTMGGGQHTAKLTQQIGDGPVEEILFKWVD